MSKITLNNIGSITQNPTSAANIINTNFSTVQTAIDNTLSRDGTNPNTMGSSLDMNSHHIINLPAPVGGSEPLRLQDASTLNGGGTIATIPAGGTTGQILEKHSNADYDLAWSTGTGGSTDASSLTSGTLAVARLPPGIEVADTNSVELWLATGQSNMVRQPSYSWTPPSNAKIWNLTLATDGSVGTAFVALPTTTITFCNAFIADRAIKYPNKTIYLLNVGKDSNPISQWLPGASSVPPLMDVYANIQANITAALAAAGVTKITGMLWWQGETDCANGSTTWRTDFETVVTRFQTNTWFPSTTPWVVCGIGGRNNNSNLASGGLAGDLFNNYYILPAVNASPQYRRYLDTSAWPYISADGVQYWESAVPDHFLGQGYFESGAVASKSFYHDVGGLVSREQRPMNLAGVGTIDSPVTWNFNKAATVAPLSGGGVVTYWHMVAADGDLPVMTTDSYSLLGLSTIPRHADGTLAAKTAVASGRTIHQISPQAWDGSSYNTIASIRFKAASLQSGSDHGSKLVLATTPVGSTTQTDQLFLEPDGSLSVGQDVSAGAGVINALNGFRISNAAASAGHVLRANGTNYVDAQLALSDLATFSSSTLATALTDEVSAAGVSGKALFGTAGNLPATATNDSASTGNVGEFIQCANTNTSGLSTATVTISNATPAVITETGHGLTAAANNFAAVNFTTTGSLPTGLTVGTNYYITVVDANTYKVSTSVANAIAGTFVATSTAGSGTQTVIHRGVLTTSGTIDIGGISLTAGDWDITAVSAFTPAATTNVQTLAPCTSLTSGTLDNNPGRITSFQFGSSGIVPVNGFTIANGTSRISLSSTTTVFLTLFSVFTVSTLAGSGIIRARRVR